MKYFLKCIVQCVKCCIVAILFVTLLTSCFIGLVEIFQTVGLENRIATGTKNSILMFTKNMKNAFESENAVSQDSEKDQEKFQTKATESLKKISVLPVRERSEYESPKAAEVELEMTEVEDETSNKITETASEVTTEKKSDDKSSGGGLLWKLLKKGTSKEDSQEDLEEYPN